jgi:receptor expression-enhancing protein 5/6
MVKNEENSISLIEVYHNQMALIKEKTGIHGSYVLALLFISVLFVYLNVFESFITNLVGTLYPAFWTMKSIEMKGDDDKQWLTYWVVFAFFSIIDMFSGFILKFIPFYFFLKIIFLIWLFMPNSGGAHIIYHLLVVRVFKSFEKDIDHATDKFSKYTKEIINKGKDYIDTGVNITGAKVMANILRTNKIEDIIGVDNSDADGNTLDFSDTNRISKTNGSNGKQSNPFKRDDDKIGKNNVEKVEKNPSEKLTNGAKNVNKLSSSNVTSKLDPKRDLKRNKKNN